MLFYVWQFATALVMRAAIFAPSHADDRTAIAAIRGVRQTHLSYHVANDLCGIITRYCKTLPHHWFMVVVRDRLVTSLVLVKAKHSQHAGTPYWDLIGVNTVSIANHTYDFNTSSLALSG